MEYEKLSNYEAEKILRLVSTLCRNCSDCRFGGEVVSHLNKYASNGVESREGSAATSLLDICSSGECLRRDTLMDRKNFIGIILKEREKKLEEEETDINKYIGDLLEKKYTLLEKYSAFKDKLPSNIPPRIARKFERVSSKVENVSPKVGSKVDSLILDIKDRKTALIELSDKIKNWGAESDTALPPTD